MIVTESIDGLDKALSAYRAQGLRIALVPTMGNLHAGHLSLIRAAREQAPLVVVSLYVNPFQFGANEDLATYPRTFATDRAALEAQHVDVLFAPDDRVMYPRGVDRQTVVMVPHLGEILCGVSRPVFFRGVTTVVARLFNLVRPDLAVFGKKDYQQCVIIRRMVADLAMPIDIVAADTVRAPDGLAMSSRNGYLDAEQRAVAPNLYRILNQAADEIRAGRRDFEPLQDHYVAALESLGFVPDYVSIRRQDDLDVPDPRDRRLVILAAARLGRTRLIDNLEINLGN